MKTAKDRHRRQRNDAMLRLPVKGECPSQEGASPPVQRGPGRYNGVQQSDVAAGSIGTLKSGAAIEPKRS